MNFIDRSNTKPNLAKAQKSADLTDSYNSTTIKRHLINSYSTCCYCQNDFPNNSYPEVEHFYPQSTHTNLKTKVENLHLACKRCNTTKKDFNGTALSPNYYLDNSGNWKLSNQHYIHKHLKYIRYTADYSIKYQDFFEILKLNGQTTNEQKKLQSALIQDRSKYYMETRELFIVVYKIIKCDQHLAESIFKNHIIPRFKAHNKYSKMINDNFTKLRDKFILVYNL